MTEQELRAIVRDAIERHLQDRPSPAAGVGAEGHGGPPPGLAVGRPRPAVASGALSHMSHAMFVFAAEPDGDGRCIIEPAVACTHCGYCKSYGH